MSCYHRIGRTKKAWACPHPYKLHYSKGLCQNCYLSKYYHDKKAERLNISKQQNVNETGDTEFHNKTDENTDERKDEDKMIDDRKAD